MKIKSYLIAKSEKLVNLDLKKSIFKKRYHDREQKPLDLKNEISKKKKLHRLLKVKKGLGKLDLFYLDKKETPRS